MSGRAACARQVRSRPSTSANLEPPVAALVFAAILVFCHLPPPLGNRAHPSPYVPRPPALTAFVCRARAISRIWRLFACVDFSDSSDVVVQSVSPAKDLRFSRDHS
ncbi:proline-rich receptor-like protein kinase PERK8 [Iris pallida]|uniref:Proline-rich receptor-like protein kinase PERK8 n=1 Tax=Iris pallida TaxID=29817 RepID=A0AAX6GVL6_IRIPA|nr:proline-rich receptor-like protein kinase PERK8 [Iris pallida]KAJ6832573.1 proline-rich receptor-like protein kinase PERK8 [Iris pallida]